MLAHFFEEEGVPTTQISLIRLHTEIIEPPRALWVSFELGRPLGAPNDPAFQKRVLLAVLKVLEAPSGPVLQDFPEDAPPPGDRTTILACPVTFPQEQVNLTETEQLCAALKSEMMSIRPWYEMSVNKRGRTTVGVSGLDLDSISDFICSFLGGQVPENPRDDIGAAYTLKLAVDDLKAYYFEAIISQPGQELPSGEAFSSWFWEETVAAQVLLALRETCIGSEDQLAQMVGRMLIVPAKIMRDRKH